MELETIDAKAFDDFKLARQAGIQVYWKQPDYQLSKDGELVCCVHNQSCVGLHGVDAGDGKVYLTHKPEDLVIHSPDFMGLYRLWLESRDSSDLFGSAMSWLGKQCDWMTYKGIFIPQAIEYHAGLGLDYDDWHGLQGAEEICKRYKWSAQDRLFAHHVVTTFALFLNRGIDKNIGTFKGI